MAQSKEKQPIKMRYADEWMFNYDAVKVSGTDEAGEATEHYEFNSVKVSKLEKDAIVPAIIRQKYTADEELKLHRLALADSENAEFAAYNAFVEDAKLVADILLGKIALADMTVSQLDRTAKLYGLADYPSGGLKAEKYEAIELYFNPPAPEPEPEVEEEINPESETEADPASEPETEETTAE